MAHLDFKENHRPFAEECIKRIIALTGLTHGSFTPRWGKSKCGSRNQIEAMNISMTVMDSPDWASSKGHFMPQAETCEFEDGKTTHRVGSYAAALLGITESGLLQLSCTQLKESMGDFMIFPVFAEMSMMHPGAEGKDSICIPFDDLERRHARERAERKWPLPRIMSPHGDLVTQPRHPV